MHSIIIPLYVDDFTEKLKFLLNYHNCLGVKHEVIIVDDCSPISIPYNKYPNIRWARVETDITWNQAGARNLGAHIAKGNKLVFVDFEHLLPVKLDIFRSGITLFKRLYQGEEIRSAQGIVGINRKDFKGYDEDFAGYYGMEDKLFVNVHPPVQISDNYLITYDNREHHLIRDRSISSRNSVLYREKMAQVKSGTYVVPEQLRFDWTVI